MTTDNSITHESIKHEKRLLMAIQLAKRSEFEKAKTLLETVLRKERTNELAWIWMANVANTSQTRRKYLQYALEVNPNNKLVEDAILRSSGVAEEHYIDWNELSLAAKTSFDYEEHQKLKETLFGKVKEPINKQRLAMNIGIFALSGYFLLSVIFPSIRIMNLIYSILPQTGNADVTFVRLTQLDPITDSDIIEVEEDTPEQGYAVGIVPPYEIGEQAPQPDNTTRWLVEVTVTHNSTEDGYVDGWELIYPNGQVIVPRGFDQRHTYIAIRPRSTESFTTEQTVDIRNNVSTLRVRAHDTNGGYGGQEIIIDFEALSGDGYEIIRTN